MRAATAAVCVVCVLSCATNHRVVATGGQLHHGVATLRTGGRATVDATEVDEDGEHDTRATIAIDQTVVVDGKPRVVRDLIRNCADAPPFAEDKVSGQNCPLVLLRGERFELQRYEMHRATPVIAGAIFGVVVTALVGSVTCGLACRDGSTAEEASEITLGVLGVGLGAAVVWAIVSCIGKGGQPGCRD